MPAKRAPDAIPATDPQPEAATQPTDEAIDQANAEQDNLDRVNEAAN